MLRVIIKTKYVCHISGTDKEGYQTFDFNNEKLEQILTQGGSGENGCLHSDAIGIEVIKDEK